MSGFWVFAKNRLNVFLRNFLPIWRFELQWRKSRSFSWIPSKIQNSLVKVYKKKIKHFFRKNQISADFPSSALFISHAFPSIFLPFQPSNSLSFFIDPYFQHDSRLTDPNSLVRKLESPDSPAFNRSRPGLSFHESRKILREPFAISLKILVQSKNPAKKRKTAHDKISRKKRNCWKSADFRYKRAIFLYFWDLRWRFPCFNHFWAYLRAEIPSDRARLASFHDTIPLQSRSWARFPLQEAVSIEESLDFYKRIMWFSGGFQLGSRR